MDNDDVQRSILPLERPLVDLDLDVLGLEHVLVVHQHNDVLLGQGLTLPSFEN